MQHGAENYLKYLNGEDEGLEKIIRAYTEPLYFFLYSIVKDASAADELVEETFFKLAVKRPRFSGRSTFKTWIFAIAHHLAIDHLRQQVRLQKQALSDTVSDFEEDVEELFLREERRRILHQSLSCLPEQYRQVLYLVYFESFAPKEAAQILKKTEKQTYNLLFRAKEALKTNLTQRGYRDEDLL